MEIIKMNIKKIEQINFYMKKMKKTYLELPEDAHPDFILGLLNKLTDLTDALLEIEKKDDAN